MITENLQITYFTQIQSVALKDWAKKAIIVQMDLLQHWNNYLMTLPDSSFFQLYRNYVGQVQTPFHKPGLIDRFNNFFKQEKTQRQVLALLDDEDLSYLSAVFTLEHPSPRQLYELFREQVSFLENHHKLINLEERLLIFRNMNSDNARYHINPLLADALIPRISHFAFLEWVPAKEILPVSGLFDEAFLISFLVFLARNPSPVKIDGDFKQKFTQDVTLCFPFIRDDWFPLAFKMLHRLNFLDQNEQSCTLNYHAICAFGKLSYEDRLAYILASASSVLPLIELALVAKRMLFAIGTDRAFDRTNCLKFFKLADPVHSSREYNTVLDAWIQGDFLLAQDQHLAINPVYRKQNVYEGSPFLIHANFELVVLKPLSFANAWFFPFCTKLEKYDTVPHFLLDKEAFFSGIKHGLSGKRMLQFLGGHQIPQNVRVSIEGWEKQFNAVQLFQGIILCVDERNAAILKHHQDELQHFILKEISDTVYILDPAKRQLWEKWLASLDMNNQVFNYLSQETKDSRLQKLDSVPIPEYQVNDCSESNEALKNLTIEGEKKIAALLIGEQEKKELLSKLSRKLVLFPQQIHRDNVSKDKMEAKGLDYLGKVRLIEQVLSDKKDLLEVVCRDENGEPQRMLVKPEFVTHEGKELMLEALLLPDEKTIRLKVAKLSLVRRIRTSLMS